MLTFDLLNRVVGGWDKDKVRLEKTSLKSRFKRKSGSRDSILKGEREIWRELARGDKKRILYPRARCTRSRSILFSDTWPMYLVISNYTRTYFDYIHTPSLAQPAFTERSRTFRKRDRIGEMIPVTLIIRSRVSSIARRRGRANYKNKILNKHKNLHDLIFTESRQS